MTDITKRRLLAGTALVAVGGIALYNTSESATASLSWGSLEIDDQTIISPQQDPETVDLETTIEYEYSADIAPESYELTLKVGQSGPDYTIDTVTQDGDLPSSGSGVVDLAGSITGTPDWDVSLFNRDTGHVSSDVHVEVIFDLYANGDTIASDSIATVFEMTVMGGEIDADIDLSGEGELEVYL